jgi:aldehyde dehydrogenase (NAD+)
MPLGRLVSWEMGKSLQEGWGEVQEMIDIGDFAVGQSRQLYGFTMHSERPSHRMYDQYHPLGPVGVITAFNFPVAVWSWNALMAAVCGDVVIWKPASLSALDRHCLPKNRGIRAGGKRPARRNY